MVDAWAETLAAIALLGTGTALIIAWLGWAQLRAMRDQLSALQREASDNAEKVERLGGIVAALRATIETKIQKLQISALERQVEMATAALKSQDIPVELPRIRPVVGSPASLTVSGLPNEGAGAPNGAMIRFRSWVGLRRRSVGQDFGTRGRKGIE